MIHAEAKKKAYLEAIRQILKYIRETIDFGFLYIEEEINDTIGYCDANYRDHDDTRQLISR